MSMKTDTAQSTVFCPYCDGAAPLVSGDKVYPHRPDLFKRYFYLCAPCSAWVGCHPDSTKPLGRLADSTLRKAKSAAHRAFDVLWRDGTMSRSEAYAWLGQAMDLPPKKCHIGMFDIEQASRVPLLVKRYRESAD